MSTPLPIADEHLKDRAIAEARAGHIESARETASQIADVKYQRWAWMGILYAQLYELKDLRGVKETILSLPDSKLWRGSWVHDLVLCTAQSGDIEGAKMFVERMSQPSFQGHLISVIISAQAHRGDYQGALATLDKIQPDSPYRDIGLVAIIHAMVQTGARIEAKLLADRIIDPGIKAKMLEHTTIDPPVQGT